MTRSVYRWMAVFSILSCAFFLQASCAKKESFDKTVISINDYRLSRGEFEELFHEYGGDDTPANRQAFLDHLITRKLLLGEAQGRGLDTQKPFLRSVENFWEKSLLKIVVDAKSREIESGTEITEAEIAHEAEAWTAANPGSLKPLSEIKDLIQWRLHREKETNTMQRWIDELASRAVVSVDKKALGIE